MKNYRPFVTRVTLLLSLVLFAAGCKEEFNDVGSREPDLKSESGKAVYVLDENTVARQLQSVAPDGTLTFSELDVTLRVGDVICAAPTENAPYGLLYKVKSVTLSGGLTVVKTEPASLEEVVQDAEIEQHVEIDDFVLEVYDDNGNLVPSTRATSANVKLNVNRSISLDKLKASINGPIEGKISLDFGISIKNWRLNDLKFLVTPELMMKLRTYLDGYGDINSRNLSIAKIKPGPITIWIGIVPVVFTPEVVIDLFVDMHGTLKVDATLVDINYKYTYGVKYANGKFSAVKQNDSKSPKIMDSAQVLIVGNTRIEPSASVKLRIYDQDAISLAGKFYTQVALDPIYLDSETGEGYDLTRSGNPKLKLACGIELEGFAKVEILSMRLAEWKLPPYVLNWELWNREVFPSFDDAAFSNPTSASIDVATKLHGTAFTVPVLQYGFSWGQNYPPTVRDNKNELGIPNPFAKELSLQARIEKQSGGGAHYVRPYFKNLLGTFYGRAATYNFPAAPVSVSSVVLDRTSASLGVMNWMTLNATVLPNNAANKSVTWASSNPSVAAVNGGMVFALSPGTAIISVTTIDGAQTAICTLTVQ
ncbi:MAG: Ig-like domain-containing protein [Prevotellaceae bacterium]|jgi:hypothetical protein|nr:Ig-like domain-containing protein [Prevotellaceae bacterium]